MCFVGRLFIRLRGLQRQHRSQCRRNRQRRESFAYHGRYKARADCSVKRLSILIVVLHLFGCATPNPKKQWIGYGSLPDRTWLDFDKGHRIQQFHGGILIIYNPGVGLFEAHIGDWLERLPNDDLRVIHRRRK